MTTVIGNRAVGIHRIWFRPGEIKAVKKIAPRRRNRCGLHPPMADDAVSVGLGIAEGVEAALAASFAFSPIWSTIDAGQLAKFPIIAGLESLTIFADFDKRLRRCEDHLRTLQARRHQRESVALVESRRRHQRHASTRRARNRSAPVVKTETPKAPPR